MSDGHAHVLSSDAIPQEPPVLSEWPYFHWFAIEGDYWRILGDITALQTGPPSSIPPDGPGRMRVSVAPNPFGGATTIEWRGNPREDVGLSIHDVTGG
jgi:hypothetical protein